MGAFEARREEEEAFWRSCCPFFAHVEESAEEYVRVMSRKSLTSEENFRSSWCIRIVSVLRRCNHKMRSLGMRYPRESGQAIAGSAGPGNYLAR